MDSSLSSKRLESAEMRQEKFDVLALFRDKPSQRDASTAKFILNERRKENVNMSIKPRIVLDDFA